MCIFICLSFMLVYVSTSRYTMQPNSHNTIISYIRKLFYTIFVYPRKFINTSSCNISIFYLFLAKHLSHATVVGICFYFYTRKDKIIAKHKRIQINFYTHEQSHFVIFTNSTTFYHTHIAPPFHTPIRSLEIAKFSVRTQQ